MNTIFVFATPLVYALFLLHIVRVSLYEIYLLQLKEYRWDRLYAHIHNTLSGRKIIFNPLVFIKWIVFVLSLVLLETTGALFWIFIVLIVYLMESSVFVRRGTHALVVPKLTSRSIVVIILTSLIMLFLFILTEGNMIIKVQFFDRLLPLVILFSIAATAIPSIIYKMIMVIVAKRKIKSNPGLTTIGITGSYGKTSTKEFLYQLLEKDFKVLKTIGSQNTEIGVAQTVVRNLKSNDFFIVEMGAYKKGEIAAICRIVNPKVGIITGVNIQHLELFGSLENIMKAKFELILSIQKGGVIIFNYDNKLVRQMVEWTKKRRPDLKMIFCITNKSKVLELRKKERETVLATNQVIQPHFLSFDMEFKNKTRTVHTNLSGVQNIPNILLASGASLYLGLSFDRIVSLIRSIKSADKTMKIISQEKKMTVIDDTFNANPDGVTAALDYMKIYKGKKILVMTPLIELGEESRKVHNEFGGKAGKICDKIILTNNNFYSDINEGIKETGKKKLEIKVETDPNILVNILKKDYDPKGIILFEGKEASKALELFDFPDKIL